jgi:hypothetical protein
LILPAVQMHLFNLVWTESTVFVAWYVATRMESQGTLR